MTIPNRKQKTSPNVLSVTELTAEIRFNVSNSFSSVFVAGEISGLSRPSSGHLYFTLKDQQAQINGIIWRSDADRIARTHKFKIENGIEFICRGGLDVYPQRGTYQLIVRDLQPVGAGALELAFQQLHAKLQAEGLFDPSHKKRLPKFPRHVAVVTSPSGAAVRDFLQVLDRRWPNLTVTIIPVKVQGVGSADEIATAIHMASQFAEKPDVIVVTRGGGSIEDLWSFNEEIVCRAIFASSIPVISGVGHEIDVTLSDLVSDVRALTPSEAAERLVPDQNEILDGLDQLKNRLRNCVLARYQNATQEFRLLASKTVLKRPLNRIQTEFMELDRLDEKMQRLIKQKLTDEQSTVREWVGRLESINPLSVLARGYSLTSDSKGRLIADYKSLAVGDTIITRLKEGNIVSQIQKIDAGHAKEKAQTKN